MIRFGSSADIRYNLANALLTAPATQTWREEDGTFGVGYKTGALNTYIESAVQDGDFVSFIQDGVHEAQVPTRLSSNPHDIGTLHKAARVVSASGSSRPFIAIEAFKQFSNSLIKSVKAWHGDKLVSDEEGAENPDKLSWAKVGELLNFLKPNQLSFVTIKADTLDTPQLEFIETAAKK